MKPIPDHDLESMRPRFMKQVRVEAGPDGCWIWTGAKVKVPGGIRPRILCGSKRRYRAHRVSYRLYVGVIPDGLDVLHKCDVTLCVRPDHLFTGDQKDNMRDAAEKGRIRNRPRRAFLTGEDYAAIRERYSTGESASVIARDFDCHRTLIYKIHSGVRGKEQPNGTNKATEGTG